MQGGEGEERKPRKGKVGGTAEDKGGERRRMEWRGPRVYV